MEKQSIKQWRRVGRELSLTFLDPLASSLDDPLEEIKQRLRIVIQILTLVSVTHQADLTLELY